jgi:hypothetical protein
MKAWLAAIAAACVGYLSPLPVIDVDQAVSDAAGTIAYASLAKSADAAPPAPMPDPKPIKADAAPVIADPAPDTAAADKPLVPQQSAQPAVAHVPAVAPSRPTRYYPPPNVPTRWRRW